MPSCEQFGLHEGAFEMNRRIIAKSAMCFGLILSAASVVSAQAQSAAPPAQAAPAQSLAWSPAQSIGMFAFPRNGQSADQQLKDESECYGMAKQRTGIDAQSPPPKGLSEEEKKAAQQQAANNAPQAQGTRVRGAARGAAGGAAVGAIAGDAGKGAAAGAVVGTMKGGAAQRSANAQSKQQAAAQTAAAQKKAEDQLLAQHQEGLDTFQRAFAACMDARNYSVK
jgi:Glycine-zipper domain